MMDEASQRVWHAMMERIGREMKTGVRCPTCMRLRAEPSNDRNCPICRMEDAFWTSPHQPGNA